MTTTTTINTCSQTLLCLGSTTGVYLAQCFAKAGVPAGVFNLVTGRGSEIGDYLTQHPAVNCISFTGGDTGTMQCGHVVQCPLHYLPQQVSALRIRLG